MQASRKISRAMAMLMAVGLVSLGVAPAQGQAPPPKPTPKKVQSEAKIPISKESVKEAGGEVVLCANIDSALALAAQQRDQAVSEAKAEQAELDAASTAAKLRAADADKQAAIRAVHQEYMMRDAQVEREKAAQLAREKARGWYIGAGVGGNVPAGTIRDAYASGYNGTLMLGFDATDNPWGFRIDGAFDQIGGTHTHNVTTGALMLQNNPVNLISASADAKYRLELPGAIRNHLYLLAGGNGHFVYGGIYGMGSPNGATLPFSDARLVGGFNGGLGASFKFGSNEIFTESRVVTMFTNYAYADKNGLGKVTTFVPIVVGMNWF